MLSNLTDNSTTQDQTGPLHPSKSSVMAKSTTRRVSIVIPVYNCGPGFLRAADSARLQHDVDWDLILVNDGSTDDTAHWVDKYCHDVTGNVRAIHQTNGGPAAARNAGVKAATADWVAFLDHDDQWDSHKLTRQLQALQQHAADICLTAACNVGSDRVAADRLVPNVNKPSNEIFQQLLFDNFITTSSVVVRKDAFQKAGGFDSRWRGIEDWALWLQLAANGCRFTAVNEALVRYTWSDDSLSKNHVAMHEQRQQLLDEMFDTPQGAAISVLQRHRIKSNELLCSAWFTREDNPGLAFRLYANAALHWPFQRQPWLGLASFPVRFLKRLKSLFRTAKE